MRRQILEKRLDFWVIDAYQVAADAGMGRRINTIMQTCFFAISGILDRDVAIAAIKQAVEKTYGRKSKRLAELNFKAIDMTLAHLHQVKLDGLAAGQVAEPADALAGIELPAFVRDVTLPIYRGLGDRLPVSLMPADGTFPMGTAKYEKRSIALEIPVWDKVLCTQCGKCVLVCPHSAIRSRAFAAERSQARPPARRPPSGTSRPRARNSRPAPISATRWPRRIAPAAATAWRPAPSMTRATSPAGR